MGKEGNIFRDLWINALHSDTTGLSGLYNAFSDPETMQVSLLISQANKDMPLQNFVCVQKNDEDSHSSIFTLILSCILI